MTTLYVSDLDGTLLRSDQKTSAFTNQTINELVQQGMLFSYATARSYYTATRATHGLLAPIPLILYNGVLIQDNHTKKRIASYVFDDDIKHCLDQLIAQDIYPIVYSLIHQEEKFSFIKDKCTPAMLEFIHSRQNDPRSRCVSDVKELYQGEIFYITCIDHQEKLEPFYQQYQKTYHCIFSHDIYTHEQWLEIVPAQASKANAVLQLKKLYHCDKVVVFGDGKNDIDMFQIADEAYAVENADPALKTLATKIIASHEQDAVAHFLKEHFPK